MDCVFSETLCRESPLRKDEMKQRGFSLIEMLFVMLVFMILAAIAAPYLVTIKMGQDRTNAVDTLRATANQALLTCLTTGTTVTTQSYTFVFSPGPCNTAPSVGNASFTMTAAPTMQLNTRYYYVDQGPPFLVIRYSDGSPANTGSNPIP